MTPDQATALSNESRKQEARAAIADLTGEHRALSQIASILSTMQSDIGARLGPKTAELRALEAGAGPGVTDAFGPYSSTDQALRAERFAGKAAWVDFVKANPDCSEADALPAYTAAALAVRPADRQWLLHDPAGLRQEYTAALVGARLIPDSSWASWRAWILATPRDVILGQG